MEKSSQEKALHDKSAPLGVRVREGFSKQPSSVSQVTLDAKPRGQQRKRIALGTGFVALVAAGLWSFGGVAGENPGLEQSSREDGWHRRFPKGKWVPVKVSAQDSPSYTESADGWSRLPRWMSLAPQNAQGSNWGLRASFAHLNDGAPPELWLRENGPFRYSAHLDEDGHTLVIQRYENEGMLQRITLGKRRLPEPIKPGQAYHLEFFAIHQRLIARLDDQLLDIAALEVPYRGYASIYGVSRDAFRGVEHVNLDGVPHAEALNLVGVGDFTGPPQPALSEAVSAASAEDKPGFFSQAEGMQAAEFSHFPLGQWKAIPVNLKEMPFLKSRGNGWLTSSGVASTLPVGIKGTNWGLRVTFRHQHRAQVPELLLRSSHESNFNAYLEHGGKTLTIQHFDRHADARYQTLRQIDLPQAAQPGRAYTLEFFAIGQVLLARYRDVVMEVTTKNTPQAGQISIYGIHFDDFRDVEVMNLEGVPEATALQMARGKR